MFGSPVLISSRRASPKRRFQTGSSGFVSRMLAKFKRPVTAGSQSGLSRQAPARVRKSMARRRESPTSPAARRPAPRFGHRSQRFRGDRRYLRHWRLFARSIAVCGAFLSWMRRGFVEAQLRLTAESWGLTAHGLFILQCSNYLFSVELENPLAYGAAGVPRQKCRIPATSAKAQRYQWLWGLWTKPQAKS